MQERKAEFQSHLFLFLNDLFDKRGYEILLNREQFRKNNPRGFQNMIPSVSMYEDVSIIEINLGVRIHQVEELAHQFTQTHQDFRADTNTMMVSLGRLQGKKYFRHKAANLDELKVVCEKIAEFMTNQGFAFLEQMSHVEHLEPLINAQPEQPCLYIYNQYYRFLKGIILAKLNYSPNLDQLVEIYHQQIKKQGLPAEQRQHFEKLALFLRSFSLN